MRTTHMTEAEAAYAFPSFADTDAIPGDEPLEDGTTRGAIVGIPSESDFDAEEVDFLPAPDIEAIGDRLRAEKPHLREIAGYRIAYWWKRSGGTAGGRATLGKCTKTPALARALKRSTWTIWLAADHLRDFRFTDRQVEALVFHQLLHCALKEVEVKDKDSGATDIEYRPALIGHDLEMFWAEVAEYGLWTAELRRAKPIFEQAELPGIDEVVGPGGKA